MPSMVVVTPASAERFLNRRLGRTDFNRPTLRVARDLLGKFIVRSDGARRMSAMITEVEAYKGPQDLASHARGGRRTRRVEPLYGDGGIVYVYFVYGMHWLLNFSTAGPEKPEAVLIRAVLADPDGACELVVGPGRLTRALEIDKALDGVDATTSKEIWLEDRGVRVPASRVKRGPRVGVDYAGEYWAARPWRFQIDADVGAATPIRRKAPGSRRAAPATTRRPLGNGRAPAHDDGASRGSDDPYA